jgi:predicted P-loop ATPase/GTPase
MAFLISPHNAIDIKVFLNQKIIDIWRFEYNIFDKQIQKHVLVDPEVMKINHGRIHLELEIISPASPQILNVSSDCRELGLLISSIGCHKVNMS